LDSGLDCYQDCGTYDIQWTVAPERLMEVSEHIQKICQSIAEKGITEDEFEAAKTRELFEWRCNLDDSQSLAETLATYTLFGRQLDWSTHRQKVGEITLEHINHVAQKLFTKSPRQMSLMGADLKRYRIAQHGKITKLSAHVPLRLL
jgi:predicted Zn-dependent peptidase